MGGREIATADDSNNEHFKVGAPIPRAHIERIATRKITGFLGTIDDDGEYYDPVHKQNQSLSQHIIADYHGRFLIELIQNGHDAHDRERRDGEIAMLLASDEGASGTLYVANRGQPFGPKNVDALCEMGLSSKPPGKAVGNKGLGFRSVRHVTDTPQIFSRLVEGGTDDRFDGYCFTFGRGAELDPLLPDETTRALARSDLPAFYIPRWIDEVPSAAVDFASRGFSTVIRLPIRNDAALEVVRNEMVGLAKAEAPMLLFLRRIGRLEVKIEGGRLKDDAFALELSRREEPLFGTSGPSLVDLGENGRFWVARADIPEPEMQAAVAEGLESGELPQSWKGWKGTGEVATAVPVGEDRRGFNPRLYTFLPMGRGATSPFEGHLHGSFFPSSNRVSLDPTVRVNSLVLEHAVRLASQTARWLQEHGSTENASSVPLVTAARAAVDLLIWTTPTSLLASGDENEDDQKAVDLGKVMAAEIARRWSASSLGDAAFIPCLGDWTGDALARPEFGPIIWMCPATARRPIVGAFFSLEVIARFGCSAEVAPIWPGLGQRRTDLLANFLRLHAPERFQDQITTVERAEIVEGLSKALAKARKPDWKNWTAFYRDLSDFMGGDSGSLAGREILFCQDGTLRAMRPNLSAKSTDGDGAKRRRRRGARDASVFFPPRRGDAEEGIGEDFYPPAPLREFFAFLHDALPWYGDLAAARQFLEKDLATPFESEALLTRISQIVERDATKKVRTAGLRWAFAIWRRSVAIKRPVALSVAYRLFVPTMDGKFVRASEAVFSSAWPDRTLGHQLQRFLELAPVGSNDIDEVRARRIAQPSSAVFGTKFTEEWTDFLTGLGVQRGLQPRSDELKHYVPASRVTSFNFMEDLGLPESFGPLLKKDIASRAGISLRLPTSTDYDVGALWWMPGQADIDEFSDDALDAYARLIVNWVGRVERRQLWTEIKHRYSYRSDNRDWPTPLAAFLRSAAWIPCDEPSGDGLRRRRCTGQQVWLSRSTDRYPPFLRRPSYKLVRALDRASDGAIDNLRKYAEFRTFNANDTLLEQTGFLAEQFAEGCIRRFYERELMNIYSRCWARLAERHGSPDAAAPIGEAPRWIIVRRSGQLGVAKVTGSEAETVYVRDSADSIAASLVEVIGDPLVDVRVTEPGRLGVLLQKLYGERIRRTSELAYAIQVDGAPLAELPVGPRLVDRCPWLRPMLAVALEALDSVDLNRLPADRSGIVQALDRIELQLQASVKFLLEGRDVSPPTTRAAYQFERVEGEPLVIIVGQGALTWSLVEAALPAIGEAIQHSAAVPHMKLLIRQLSLEGVEVDDRPMGHKDLLRLCQALDLTEQASESARDSLGERIDRQLPWFRAVVFHLGGDSALERWSEGELAATEDRATLVELLRACLPPGDTKPEEVQEAVKVSFSIGELRERLGLDFAEFNASLLAIGSEADIDPEGHALQLEFYIRDNRIAVVDALRNMVAPTILKFHPDSRYKDALETLSGLKPDPEWLLSYERIPEDLLATHVATWLTATGAQSIGENPSGLGELIAVRAANTATLRQFARIAQPLVRAWGIQRSVHVHDLWHDAGQAEIELRRHLDDAGAFDCRTWSDAELLVWFARLGAWPAKMPQTLDRVELDVPETEIEAEAQKAREERDRRNREARSVHLNGELRDPQDVDWLELSDEISENLSKNLLNRPIGKFADLTPFESTRMRGRTRGSGGGGGAYRGVPQEKKDMIGRLGELIVYHWLKARQPSQDIDRCWVSGNAVPFTGREGEDGLGYDFCIAFNKQTWYIEVKASTEDPCQFELGETEVRRARDVARSSAADRYVIAYVANVGQTGSTTIDILPNPFGPDADGVLKIAGDSIRYMFDRAH